MDIFEAAHIVSLQENPLTAQAAGKLTSMKLERHARVREVLPRGGARSQGDHRRFDTDNPFGGEGLGASAFGTETAPGDGEASEEEVEEPAGGVEYDDAGEISVSVPIPTVREYFTKIQSRHKDPVGQPQEWFDVVVSNRIMRLCMDRRSPEGTTQRMGSGRLGWSDTREREGSIHAHPGAQRSHE